MQYLTTSIARRCLGARPALGATAALLLVLSGCEGAPDDAGETDTGITRTYERGPMQLTLRIPASQITTAELLDVTLTATVDGGHAVSFPPFPEPPEIDAGEGAQSPPQDVPWFAARNIEDTPPSLGEDGRVTRSRIYTLEPFLDGQYTVPPLPVSFWEEREGADEKSVLETESERVAVASVIDPDEEPDFKGIAGPVSVPEPAPWGWYALVVLILAAVLAAAAWYTYVRVPPAAPPLPPVPPHQRALQALEAIRRSGLIEEGRYKEYYIQVSDVLRRYMEEQFQLRAPERTTEEFLEEIQHDGTLALQEQLLLREFLRHCDLVKFANVEPTPEQIRSTFTTCEQFIVDSEAAQRASRAPLHAEATGEA